MIDRPLSLLLLAFYRSPPPNEWASIWDPLTAALGKATTDRLFFFLPPSRTQIVALSFSRAARRRRRRRNDVIFHTPGLLCRCVACGFNHNCNRHERLPIAVKASVRTIEEQAAAATGRCFIESDMEEGEIRGRRSKKGTIRHIKNIITAAAP